MELNFLGRDSGFGNKNNSAYYEADKKLLIIDCGYTVFNIIKEKFDLTPNGIILCLTVTPFAL